MHDGVSSQDRPTVHSAASGVRPSGGHSGIHDMMRVFVPLSASCPASGVSVDAWWETRGSRELSAGSVTSRERTLPRGVWMPQWYYGDTKFPHLIAACRVVSNEPECLYRGPYMPDARRSQQPKLRIELCCERRACRTIRRKTTGHAAFGGAIRSEACLPYTPIRPRPSEGQFFGQVGPKPTLMSSAAKSPCVAVTSVRAK